MAPKDQAQPAREHTPVAAGAVHHGPQQTVPAPAAPVQAAPAPAASKELILPPAVISRSEVSKCLREIEAMNEFFHQAGIRGGATQAVPTPSVALESLATANGLNLLQPEARDSIKHFLTRLKSKAPVVHMSFPSEASDMFLGRLLEWFRAEVHPHVLLQVGLQPELAAGCTVRTTNKFLDFSFRKRFEKSREKLISAIEELDKAPERTVVAGANDTAPAVALAGAATAPAAPTEGTAA